MLDLSAAFDTIDHQCLLARMKSDLGIDGVALKWFHSYLSGRSQCIQIDGICSLDTMLKWGVPQGSVLGPMLFLIYILPLGQLIRSHGMQLHIYADDTQIYACICPVSQEAIANSVTMIEKCVVSVQHWMSCNMLKLNAEKTEVKIFGSTAQLSKFSLESITIGHASVVIQDGPV